MRLKYWNIGIFFRFFRFFGFSTDDFRKTWTFPIFNINFGLQSTIQGYQFKSQTLNLNFACDISIGILWNIINACCAFKQLFFEVIHMLLNFYNQNQWIRIKCVWWVKICSFLSFFQIQIIDFFSDLQSIALNAILNWPRME